MANSATISIETLPVEILHRIFDDLDAPSILFSVRSVSRFFRAVVASYDRYALDSQSLSPPKFGLLCRLIQPKSVTSLVLRNNEHTLDQISPFFLSVRLRQFTQLHQITLDGIEESQLNKLLKHITVKELTSFSLKIGKHDDRRKKTTVKFLSSIMAQSGLRKLELNIRNDRLSNISWPTNCSITYLIIYDYKYCGGTYSISPNLSQLRTLILKRSVGNIIPHTLSLPQLTSLTIENLDMPIGELELILMSTPSLTYLKIIGEGCALDGKRWEEFAQIHLPYLNRFEFHLNVWKPNNFTREQIDLVIESFRSPFWIEHKKWFVAAEFNIDGQRLDLYSIPFCKSALWYTSLSKRIFVSNCLISTHTDPSVTSRINKVYFSTRDFSTVDLNDKEMIRPNVLYPQVTEIRVGINQDCLSHVEEFLSSIIDLKKLVEVELVNSYSNQVNERVLLSIFDVLEQLPSLSSLILIRYCSYDGRCLLSKNIYSRIPHQIINLEIPLDRLEHMKIILDQCPHLSRIQFEIPQTRFSEEVTQWFDENTINSTCRRQSNCTIVWIGKRINQLRVNHKRVKLSDDHIDS